MLAFERRRAEDVPELHGAAEAWALAKGLGFRV